MATPLMIAIGVHYWTTPGDYFDRVEPHWSSPAVQGCLTNFVKCGLLRLTMESPTKPCGQLYEATHALKVWVDALCLVPLPVQMWVIPTQGKQ